MHVDQGNFRKPSRNGGNIDCACQSVWGWTRMLRPCYIAVLAAALLCLLLDDKEQQAFDRCFFWIYSDCGHMAHCYLWCCFPFSFTKAFAHHSSPQLGRGGGAMVINIRYRWNRVTCQDMLRSHLSPDRDYFVIPNHKTETQPEKQKTKKKNPQTPADSGSTVFGCTLI